MACQEQAAWNIASFTSLTGRKGVWSPGWWLPCEWAGEACQKIQIKFGPKVDQCGQDSWKLLLTPERYYSNRQRNNSHLFLYVLNTKRYLDDLKHIADTLGSPRHPSLPTHPPSPSLTQNPCPTIWELAMALPNTDFSKWYLSHVSMGILIFKRNISAFTISLTHLTFLYNPVMKFTLSN